MKVRQIDTWQTGQYIAGSTQQFITTFISSEFTLQRVKTADTLKREL
ncbi:MAG: hypothetical protein KA368_10070 [Acidobacteria bacterium]|nr:hypothetical protein [Acidobacteriota bacterium]